MAKVQCRLKFRCDQQWDALQPTDNNTIRFCQECKSKVFWADSEATFKELASQNKCVAFEGDFEVVIGQPDSTIYR